MDVAMLYRRHHANGDYADALFATTALDVAQICERLVEVERAHDECVRFTVDRPLLQERVAELESALRKWRCDGIQHTHGDGGNMCLKCRDTGLHPIAAEALKEKPPSRDADWPGEEKM
jgi:hypothetical protein